MRRGMLTTMPRRVREGPYVAAARRRLDDRPDARLISPIAFRRLANSYLIKSY